jgi:hypothetical protein
MRVSAGWTLQHYFLGLAADLIGKTLVLLTLQLAAIEDVCQSALRRRGRMRLCTREMLLQRV